MGLSLGGGSNATSISDSDWWETAVELVNPNICELIDFADIAEVRGQ